MIRALPAGLRARARAAARPARWSRATYPELARHHARSSRASSPSICAARCSAKCARRRSSRCAASTRRRSRACCSCSTCRRRRSVNECRAAGAPPRLRAVGRPCAGARERQRGRGMIAVRSLGARRWPGVDAPAARRLRRSRGGAARILVVPFETPGRDGRTYWLGEAAAILMADDVNARGLGAITRTARARAYEQLHLPPHAVAEPRDGDQGRRAGRRRQVIVGDVSVDGDALTVQAQPIRIDVGRADSRGRRAGPPQRLFALVQKVARRVVPGGARRRAPAPTPSLQALRALRQGAARRAARDPAPRSSRRRSSWIPGYDRARWRSGKCGPRRGTTPPRWPRPGRSARRRPTPRARAFSPACR